MYNLSEFSFATSLTDNGKYPQLCAKAIEDDALFYDFRRNPIYNFALEHDSPEMGLEYLEIAKELQLFDSHIEEFKRNETVGNPVTVNYDQIGEISPTTLRYIKVLRDLEYEFDTLNDLHICEIGVGYGGLCRIIDSYFESVASYSLVDLPSVLGIARKYLSYFKINTPIIGKTINELTTEDSYDLVISNYAFTELKREVQDIYLQKVILKAKRGYITYNAINLPDFNCYTIDELTAIIPNVKILREIERTHPEDRILVWSND
jgi:hypothetical protein